MNPTVLDANGVNRMNELANIVAVPVVAALGLTCGMNVPAAFILTTPEPEIITFSVALVEAAVTTRAVAAVA